MEMQGGLPVVAKDCILSFGSMDFKLQNSTMRFVCWKDYSGSTAEVGLEMDETGGGGDLLGGCHDVQAVDSEGLTSDSDCEDAEAERSCRGVSVQNR